MYCEFYQMTERPFNVTPDPKCLYLNARYREALAALHYGISQRKGFITLIGEAGTGKTTLLKRLLDEFDEKTRSVFIFNTHVSFEEILEYVFAEFDLPVHNGKKLYMLQRLNTFLLEELRGGGNVALLIDEAQELDQSVLEDLRLLSNLETAKEKILQIVLSGQPELGEKLSHPTLRQLRQRIAVSCRLLPLSRDELAEYLQYRLHAVGCSDLKLFSRDAEDQIYHFSRGIPRLINVVCDNALVIGYALGKRRIGADVIAEAAADLMPVQEPVPPEVPAEVPAAPMVAVAASVRPRARFGLIAVVLLAVVIGVLSMGRSMLRRQQVLPGMSATPVLPEHPPVDVIRPGSLEMPAPETSSAVPPVGNQVQRPREVPPPDLAGAPLVQAQDLAEEESTPTPAVISESEPPAAKDRDVAVAPQAPGPEAQPETDPIKPAIRVAAARPSAPEPAAPPLWRAPSAAAQPASEQKAAVIDRPPVADGEPINGKQPMRLLSDHFDRVTVRPGDSISGIALRKYGQASHTIFDLIKLANPELRDVNVITIGQTLLLPDLSESSVVSYGANRYGVLVYSTALPARAAALEAALRARGRRSRVVKGDLGNRHPVYRVLIDGFTDRAAAAAAGKEVQRLFREDERMALLVR